MLPKNKADYIIITLFLIIFTGAVTGGILLHIQNRSIEKELAQNKQQLTELKRELESIETPGFEGREPFAPSSHKIPFDPGQQDLFGKALDQMAKENHLKIVKSELTSVSFAVKDNPDYQVSQWTLILNGEYSGLMGFLEVLPRMERPALISALKISPEYLKKNQYQLTAYLTLDVIAAQ